MEERTIKIEKLVSGGHGLGHLEGRVILVPFSALGEEVVIEVAPARKGVGWGNIRQILSPSPSRTEPVCGLFGECGGCQLQHIAYADQLEQKRLIVEDALRRLGGIEEPDVSACRASPVQRGYRRRVRFHCREGDIGFLKTGSTTLVPVDYCPVASDRINACLKQVSSHISRHPIPSLTELQVVEGTSSRIMLVLEMDGMPDAELVVELQRNVDAAGAVARAGRSRSLLWGEDHSIVLVGEQTFRVSAGSFFQANVALLPALIDEVMKAVATGDITLGVELYAGVGVFCTMLSEKVQNLVAVEWNREAAADAAHNLKAHGVRNVDVISLSAEEALDVFRARRLTPDLVVMDPPREGLSKAVREKLVRMSPRHLVYVSCDPATLARDIKFILASGAYRLERVVPLDMFPHTAHIECVCSLVRSRD